MGKNKKEKEKKRDLSLSRGTTVDMPRTTGWNSTVGNTLSPNDYLNVFALKGKEAVRRTIEKAIPSIANQLCVHNHIQHGRADLST
eukprot:COSAG02_NODE_15211_length_1193_cov_1.800731_1_plen_86_part_00